MSDNQNKQNADIERQLTEKLATLKKNRENIPLPVLKTKYRNGYQQLCTELCSLSEAFIRSIVVKDLQITRRTFPEATDIIQNAITASGLLKNCSRAVFQHQDIEELRALAEELRQAVRTALEPFFTRHICLYIAPECVEEPYPPPCYYNQATGRYYINGRWVENYRQ